MWSMILFSGKCLEKAVFVIQVEHSFVYYLCRYPEDTVLLRQIVLKACGMNISCLSRPNRRDMPAISQPVCIIKNRSMSLSD